MMNFTDETICAVSTAPGVGGIAVVRISGPEAIRIADTIWTGRKLDEQKSHTVTFGTITDPDTGEPVDEAVATIFRAPRSFTGDDVVELSVHGSLWVQRELINLLLRQGCRLAEPGEFTRRAFASGKIDLAEAEAVADVIASTSKAAHRLAMSQMRGSFSARLSQLRDKLLELASLLELELDFSEEDVEFANRDHLLALTTDTLAEVDRLASTFSTGDAIRRGIPVAIIGEPNVGKSSILNRLLGDDRAIVSDIPGTTRDTIEDTADIGGITFRFIDTAGLRETPDAIESLGIDRAWSKIANARIILWVITPDTPEAHIAQFAAELTRRKAPEATVLLLLNKADLLIPGSTAANCRQQAQPPAPFNDPQHPVTDTPCGNSWPQTQSPTQFNAMQLNGADQHCEASLLVSAATGQGFEQLQSTLSQLATRNLFGVATESAHDVATSDAVIVTNARHYQALLAAAASLRRVTDGLSAGISADFIAQDVRETIHHLSTITGSITTPDILATIFSRFCIGK